MLDIFKDGAEAWLQRIKSPLIGSFVLSFCVFNWKVIFFVIFSDTPILFRFWYFDSETSIWTLLVYPAGTGLLIGLGTPYLNYYGSWVAKWPTEKHRVLTANSASVVMTAKAELATARLLSSAKFKEAALLDAKATQAIDEANLSDDAREDLDKKVDDLVESEERDAVRNVNTTMQKLAESLTMKDLFLIDLLTKIDQKIFPGKLPQDIEAFLLAELEFPIPEINSTRLEAELKDAFDRFEALNLAERELNGGWHLTSTGYAVAEFSKRNLPDIPTNHTPQPLQR